MGRIVYCIRENVEDGRIRLVQRWDGYESHHPILTRDYDTPAEAVKAVEEEGLLHDNLVLVMEIRA